MSLGKLSPAGSATAPRVDLAEARGGPWQTGMVATATGLRLVLAPVVMALLMAGWDPLAGALFAVAAATDYLDGYFARRWRVSTATGSFLDTTADKVLVTAALIGLVAISRTSAWAALIIVGREMVIMGLRGSAAAQGVLIVASQLGRVKAAVQFLAILLSILNVGYLIGPMGIDQWVMALAVLITMGSGIDYLVRFSRVVMGRSGSSA
ncbi:MAG TPA: CDP-diacylglycerol--glycerol-3-phosphate 3-phosphatidyltransferase [Candidatus Nanopelagicaceae bacterium]|nr:CDP-diacylglycerol--glycerol-3-phosphate 3-phosphatidyltransferase [Candidatus Nanopelagicaceae bacterium]